MKVGEEILSCEPFAYVVSQSLSKYGLPFSVFSFSN